MPTIKVNDINLHYERKGKGPTLVLIPGYASDHTIWLQSMELLCPDFDILALDNRNMGRSSVITTPFSLESMADDVHDLLNTLEVKQVHLAGISMGGGIAQWFAKKYPTLLNKLILVSTFPKLSRFAKMALKTQLKALKTPLVQKGVAKLILPWLAYKSFFDTPFSMQEFMHRFMHHPHPSHVGLLRQSEALMSFDSTPWISSISHKTLIIHGSEDVLIDLTLAKQLHNLIPQSKLTVVPKGAHLVVSEQAKTFARLTKDFLLND